MWLFLFVALIVALALIGETSLALLVFVSLAVSLSFTYWLVRWTECMRRQDELARKRHRRSMITLDREESAAVNPHQAHCQDLRRRLEWAMVAHVDRLRGTREATTMSSQFVTNGYQPAPAMFADRESCLNCARRDRLPGLVWCRTCQDACSKRAARRKAAIEAKRWERYREENREVIEVFTTTLNARLDLAESRARRALRSKFESRGWRVR